MTHYLILFHSMTQAQRAARLLERKGITAYVVKAPMKLTERGCTYALSLNRRASEAAELLRASGLRMGKQFRTEDGEHFEEVRL